jgi:Ca2+-binding EF-hand superfamily protein
MRQAFGGVICLAAISLAAVASEPPQPDLELKFPQPLKGTLRLTILRRGQPLHGELEEFLAKVFAHFDRNQDGSWDAAETKRVFPFPTTTGKSLTLDFADLDLNRDQVVQIDELRAWCANQQLHWLSWIHVAPQAEDERLSRIFAVACDANGDGRVEHSELREAPKKLQVYDANDDEILDLQELLAAVDVPERRTTLVKAENQVAPWLVLDFDKPSVVTLYGDGKAGQLTVSNSRFLLLARDRTSVISGRLQRDLPPLDQVADFLAAQLEELSGGGSGLGKAIVEREESLRGLHDLFPFADRNGDDILTMTELRDYLDLLSAGLKAQYVVRLYDRDQSWFSWLDADGDQRLTPLELARLRDLPLQSNGHIGRYLELEVGTVPATVWGGVRIPPLTRRKARSPPVSNVGLPAWFTAQDRNGDGVVSRREFLGPLAKFRELDKNDNELIESAEVP